MTRWLNHFRLKLLPVLLLTCGWLAGLWGCSLDPDSKSDKNHGISVQYLGEINPPLGLGSFDAFTKSVYPLVRSVTCKDCHATNKPFASKDPKKAHDHIIVAKLVDFKKPANSTLVLRLEDLKHNCWDDCNKDAREMQDAIETWIKLANEEKSKDDLIKTAPTAIDVATVLPVPAGAPAITRWPITFDLSDLLGGTKASLRFVVTVVDEYSYQFSAPTIITSNAEIKIKDLQIEVNGKQDPQAADYRIIDKVVSPPAAQLATSVMFVSRDQGEAKDRFVITFKELSVVE